MKIWNFSSRVRLDISLVRCAHSWAIELNTRREFPYLRASMYYSIFIILAVNGPESENSVWFSSLGRCTISATQQFLIGVKQCGEHSLGTRLSFGIECSKVRWGDWFWKKAEVCVVGYLPPFWISLWLKLSHKVTYSFSVDFAAAVTLVPAFRLTVLVFPICHGINLFQSRSLSL